MSYKKQQNPSKRATWFYQDKILVDKEALVWIKTGPYRKDLCGKNIDGVIMYYNHLKDLYDKTKVVSDNNQLKEFSEEDLINAKEFLSKNT